MAKAEIDTEFIERNNAMAMENVKFALSKLWQILDPNRGEDSTAQREGLHSESLPSEGH